jgi:hypothetical protein
MVRTALHIPAGSLIAVLEFFGTVVIALFYSS